MKKIAIICTIIFALLPNYLLGQSFPKEGDMFVDFVVEQEPDNESSKISFSDYVGKGKITVVDFWASWCGPCRMEMPYIAKIHNSFPKEKVTVLSIAVADKLEASKKAATELNITWNQIVNAQAIPLKIYGINAIPHVMIFAPDGKILKIGLRGDDIYQYINSIIGDYFKE